MKSTRRILSPLLALIALFLGSSRPLGVGKPQRPGSGKRKRLPSNGRRMRSWSKLSPSRKYGRQRGEMELSLPFTSGQKELQGGREGQQD